MKKIPLFSDSAWDTMPKNERAELIVELTRNQFSFMKENVPFYKKFYEDVEARDIRTLEDCIVHIPAMKKSQIRTLKSPYDLLPKSLAKNINKLYLHRGTGGTTGNPTSVFFTKNDWKAIMDGNSRYLAPLKEKLGPLIIFDNYNQGHISAPYFESLCKRAFDCGIITRNFHSTDEQAIKQMQYHKCNALIAPPVATHKGATLESLLATDAKLGTNYINGDNIKFILCSSTGITKELYEELQSLGIHHIVNAYGSTDVGAVAISTPDDPFKLNINFGHITAFAVNEKQEPVKDGEKGYLIASKIAGYLDSGAIGPFEGTPLLNFHLGDEVTFHKSGARKGFTTPFIKNPTRVLDIEEKLAFGCQVFE